MEIKSSWASQVEEEDDLPPPSEIVNGNNKVVTDYYENDDEKKVKRVRTYKIEKKVVSKAIARRNALRKFGDCVDDRPGPDPATTQLHEETFMTYISSKDDSAKDSNDTELENLKKMNKGMIKCRICKEDHWTTTCPYKDTLGPLRESLSGTKDEEDNPENSTSPAPPAASSASASRAYVPPSRREGARDRIVGDSMTDRRRMDDSTAVRVSNLSENTQECDIQELFKPFGSIARIFLAKDKQTGQCKGFAFIHYYKKEEASQAIATLNGYGYDHLILSLEWAKPTGS